MSQHDHSSAQQSSDEQQSQNAKGTQTQEGDTINNCTMDPCPMKTESEGGKPEKCPKCGMEDEHTHEVKL